MRGSGRRGVPGLRREEVAVLAGVSTEWYIGLEKGHISGVSYEVLSAVAAPCNWTRPSCTCSIWPAPRNPPGRRSAGPSPQCGRACCASWSR